MPAVDVGLATTHADQLARRISSSIPANAKTGIEKQSIAVEWAVRPWIVLSLPLPFLDRGQTDIQMGRHHCLADFGHFANALDIFSAINLDRHETVSIEFAHVHLVDGTDFVQRLRQLMNRFEGIAARTTFFNRGAGIPYPTN